jgi:hypothetical protein
MFRFFVMLVILHLFIATLRVCIPTLSNLDYFICCVNAMEDAKTLGFYTVHGPEIAFWCVRNEIYKSALPSPDQFFSM